LNQCRLAGVLGFVELAATGDDGFKAEIGSKRDGLGLVRRLVEQVRGIASLDSENGTVSTIKILFRFQLCQMQSYPGQLALSKKRREELPTAVWLGHHLPVRPIA
jgi:hypothetical protein